MAETRIVSMKRLARAAGSDSHTGLPRPLKWAGLVCLYGLLGLCVLSGCGSDQSPQPGGTDGANGSERGEGGAGAGGGAGSEDPTRADVDGPTQAVTLGGRRFELELAITREKVFRGLSDRMKIESDGGMLFVFKQPRVLEFVMRRCLVPIDIVFLDASGRITAMHEMKVEPYDTPEERLKRYSSRYAAQFAIELAGGTLRGLGLKVGDRVELPYADLKARAQ